MDMTDRFRYTGCWPPTSILDQYPNWIFALDEEWVEGQDETTIKPETQQLHISGETCFTAAEVTQADQTARTAIIRLEDGLPSAVDVFDGRDWWSVQRGFGKKWETVNEVWLPEDERRPTVSLSDQHIFPLVVRSRLPRSDGKVLVLSIPSNGAMELNWR
jgi:hypothetical protein